MTPFIIFIGLVTGLTAYMFHNVRSDVEASLPKLVASPSPVPTPKKKLSKIQKEDLQKIDEIYDE